MSVLTLGQRMRALRVDGPYGYRTQRAAADHAGVTLVEWSRWEADRERPERVLLAYRIVPMLGANLAEMLHLWDTWQARPAPGPSRSVCRGRTEGGAS